MVLLTTTPYPARLELKEANRRFVNVILGLRSSIYCIK